MKSVGANGSVALFLGWCRLISMPCSGDAGHAGGCVGGGIQWRYWAHSQD